MKFKVPKFASKTLLAAAIAMCFCRISTAVTHEEEDVQLRELLEARRDVLKELVHLINGQMGTREKAYPEVLEVNSMLLEAELAASRTKQERTESFERALDAQQGIEQRLVAMFEIGLGSQPELQIATAARMKVQIDFHKEKTGEWPAPAQVVNPEGAAFSFDIDSPVSREARRNALEQVAQIHAARHQIGTGHPEALPRATMLVLDAELELAGSQEERIAIFEKMLKAQLLIEGVQKEYWAARVGNEWSFLMAKAEREQTAINLHKAKNGKWPITIAHENEDLQVTQEPADQELQTLLVEHRDTRKRILTIAASSANKGTARIVDVISANEAFVEAEIQLAKSHQEQVAVFQEALNVQTKLEEDANASVEAGVRPRTELLRAKAARLKVEIDLHKARMNAK